MIIRVIQDCFLTAYAQKPLRPLEKGNVDIVTRNKLDTMTTMKAGRSITNDLAATHKA